jgi:hypothetical protein
MLLITKYGPLWPVMASEDCVRASHAQRACCVFVGAKCHKIMLYNMIIVFVALFHSCFRFRPPTHVCERESVCASESDPMPREARTGRRT